MTFKIGDNIRIIDNLKDNCVKKGDEGIIIPHDNWEDMNHIDWADKKEFDNLYVKVCYSKCEGKKQEKTFYTLKSRMELMKIKEWRGLL